MATKNNSPTSRTSLVTTLLSGSICGWVQGCGLASAFVRAYAFVLSALTSGNDLGENIGAFFALGLVFLVLFTIPAALGGLLRQPALAWLSHHARSRGELLGGSLLLFETLVAVVPVLGWCYLGLADGTNLCNSFLTCFFISLPWLLATAWASRCSAAKLAIPARRQ